MSFPERLAVRISPEEISAGERLSGENCPVALALKRKTGLRWVVGRVSALATGPGNAKAYYDIPPAVTKFIRAFDDYERVRPMTAVLLKRG